MKYVFELGEINNFKLNNSIIKTAYVDVIMTVSDDNSLHFAVDLYAGDALCGDYIKLDSFCDHLHNSTLYDYLLSLYVQYNDSIVDNPKDLAIVKMLTKCKSDYSYN